VAGFPSAIPIAAGTKVISSSVSPDGAVLQVTLAATTTLDSAELVEWYSEQFAKLHLPGSQSPAVGGSTAFAFTRGSDTVTLTVTPAKSSGSRYTLIGHFTAAAG
jgi:hypothetical protein